MAALESLGTGTGSSLSEGDQVYINGDFVWEVNADLARDPFQSVAAVSPSFDGYNSDDSDDDYFLRKCGTDRFRNKIHQGKQTGEEEEQAEEEEEEEGQDEEQAEYGEEQGDEDEAVRRCECGKCKY